MIVLKILQAIVAGLLIVSIMLQPKGSQFSAPTFGTGGESYRSKRGLEKILFYTTIVLIILFAFLSILVVSL